MMKVWRPKLVCHFLWHSEFKEGPALADYAFARLCRDVAKPNSRGIGIPVFWHSWAAPGGSTLLEAVRPDAADVTVVLPLVDPFMTGSDEWTAALENLLAAQPSTPGVRLIPVALDSNSYNISTKINKLNFLRLIGDLEADRPQQLVAKLTHELCRMLIDSAASGADFVGEGQAPVQIFLSHAKQDGLPIVTELLDYLGKNSAVERFFDSVSIQPGTDFRTAIEQGVRKSAMLVVHSDAYASREWCRREVLLAKKYQCPIVVLIAVDKEEDRSFPYLGNVPAIRWDASNPRRCQDVVDRALREILRSSYFSAHLKTLQDAGRVPDTYQVLTRPPEVLTYLNLPRGLGATAEEGWNPVIYPDPPLGDEEVELIHAMAPGARLTTPASSAHWIKSSSDSAPLLGKTIALSVSDSPDLALLGMGTQHLDDAFQEFARHVLSNGAAMLYGGDLRVSGFARMLIELVQTYRLAGHEPWQRIRSFISWPLHLNQDSAAWAKIRAQYKLDAMFQAVPKPDDVSLAESGYFPPDNIERQYAWARGLTLMRETMELQRDLSARVILGGRLTDFRGRYPGVVEEALLALQSGKPLYLCGGFGGAAAAIVRAIKGQVPLELTQEFQTRDAAYKALLELYQKRRGERIDYAGLCEFFHSKGVDGLHNGLSPDDNETLFATPHITEIVYLVLKGLANLAS